MNVGILLGRIISDSFALQTRQPSWFGVSISMIDSFWVHFADVSSRNHIDLQILQQAIDTGETSRVILFNELMIGKDTGA